MYHFHPSDMAGTRKNQIRKGHLDMVLQSPKNQPVIAIFPLTLKKVIVSISRNRKIVAPENI